MAEFQLIQERNISGKGMLRVPSDISKRRLSILYASVLRKPKSEYLNLNYIPPRSKYGFLTFLRNGYVIGEGTVDFEQQSYDGVTDITGQNLIAIKCMYDGVLQSFANLVTGLGQTPGSAGLFVTGITDLIKDYEYLDLSWDEVRVKCYADTALNLRLYSLPFDSCDPNKDKPKRPPAPPPPPPQIPPGTPIDNLDRPYEDEENPDNITEPYPGDDVFIPGAVPCQKYSVTWSLTYFDGIGRSPATGTTTMFGVVGDWRVDDSVSNNWKLLIFNQGFVNNQFSECISYEERPLFQGGQDYEDVVVGEPVEVP